MAPPATSIFVASILAACAAEPDNAALEQRIVQLEERLQLISAAEAAVVETPFFTTVWAGGPFGDERRLRCPPGHIAVGIDARAGNLVAGMAMVCSPANELLNTDASAPVPSPSPLAYTQTTEAPREEMGWIGVSSSPRGLIAIDGELTSIRTPARRIPTTPGIRTIEIVWDDGRRSEPKRVDIRDGVHTNVFFREPPAQDAGPP